MADTADARLLDQMREQVEALGVKVDRRWGVDRLREEIAAAKAGDFEPEPQVESEPEPKPQVRRAGGHVDYGDDRGWVLDPDEPELVGPPEPVEPGTAGLPGHPVMAAAGWTLAKEA